MKAADTQKIKNGHEMGPHGCKWDKNAIILHISSRPVSWRPSRSERYSFLKKKMRERSTGASQRICRFDHLFVFSSSPGVFFSVHEGLESPPQKLYQNAILSHGVVTEAVEANVVATWLRSA